MLTFRVRKVATNVGVLVVVADKYTIFQTLGKWLTDKKQILN